MQLRISSKLYGGFAMMLVLLVAVGGVGLWHTVNYSSSYQKLYNDNVKAAVYLANAQNALWQLRYGFPQFMVGDAAAKAKIVADEPKYYQIIEENLSAYEKGGRTAEELQAIKELKEVYSKYIAARPKWFELQGAGKTEEAAAWRAQTTTPFGAGTVKGFTALIELQQKVGADLMKKEMAQSTRDKGLMTGLMLLALLLGTLCAFLVTRTIIKPVQHTIDLLRDIAEGEGDLTKRLNANSSDEIGELSRWFNVFIERLQSIFGQVAQHSYKVAKEAGSLHSTAEHMANGTERVAMQAGTVANASSQMAATSAEIAQNCGAMAEVANQASNSATSGVGVVQETVEGMSRIAMRVRTAAQTVESLGARSDQIGAIIGTIEDIADQTNLLALNAAIEAARAGEQGRGFAVVADEVRALAERTTKATREIGEMIKAIQLETKGAVSAMEEGVHEVEQGTTGAAKSGEALQQILDQVQNVTMQVSQIATAAEEQTATTSEITNNIQQITEVVQETAKGAQESASAASQLAQLAEDLQRLVGQFKLAS